MNKAPALAGALLSLLFPLLFTAPVAAQDAQADASSPQADIEAAVGRLKAAADKLRSGSGDLVVVENGKTRSLSRAEALRGIYSSIAALEYRESVAAGLSAEQTQASREQLSKLKDAGVRTAADDAKLVEINAKDLMEAGCPSSYPFPVSCNYYGHCVCMSAGGGTINTGRRFKPELDAKLDELGSDATKAANSFEAGRIYLAMADAAAGAGEDAKQPAPRVAAVPATPMTPRQIYAAVGPAVVFVIGAADSGGELGTGSILDATHVLTNAHVVIRSSTGEAWPEIRVYLKPAKITGDNKKDLKDPIEATVARFDRQLDLAVLELKDPPKDLKTVALGDSSQVSPGDPVVAIGHPEQGGLWTLTQGVVSTVVADFEKVPGKDVFQTDASINRGNSGGPLLASDGSQIGINTAMSRRAADGVAITAVNFSIESNVVKKWLDQSGDVKVALAPVAERPSEAAPGAAAPAAVTKPVEEPEVEAKPEPKAETPIPSAERPSKPASGATAPAVEPKILTPAKPYRAENLIEEQMKDMEDLSKEMEQEIQQYKPH